MLGSDDSGPIRMDLGHAACAATKLCKNAALWLCSGPAKRSRRPRGTGGVSSETGGNNLGQRAREDGDPEKMLVVSLDSPDPILQGWRAQSSQYVCGI
jgi:hypothetical protein